MKAKGHEVWQAYNKKEARALLKLEGDAIEYNNSRS